MTRNNPKHIAKHLEATARRLRKGKVGDLRIVAALLDRAASALRGNV